MTNFYGTGSTSDPQTPALNQIYVEGKGYDVAPNTTFWIGRRFYHRADVHMVDSFYVHGGLQGATGAGADGINLGLGSLGVAVFRKDDAAAGGNAGTLLNLDLQDIASNPNGKLRLVASFTNFSGTNGESGAGLTLQHNQSGVFGADNTLWLQYAKGSTWLDMGFAGGTQDSDYKRWRIADSLAWLKGPLTAQTLLHYGKAEEPAAGGGTNSATTFSMAGRVAYAFTKNFKLQGELGTARTKPDGGSSQTVTKLTIAPTLTVGPNDYDRPELRFYVSTFNSTTPTERRPASRRSRRPQPASRPRSGSDRSDRRPTGRPLGADPFLKLTQPDPDRDGQRPAEGAEEVVRRRDRSSTASTSRSRDGEFMVFVGPSGCGKSHAAAHDRRAGGHHRRRAARSAASVVNDVPPAKRGIAMVFQSYALYPHMTVSENMAFGLKLAGMPQGRDRRRGRSAPRKILQIEHLLDRKPKAAVGRPAPARGDRPRHRAQARGVPVRRAAVQPRRRAARADARASSRSLHERARRRR